MGGGQRQQIHITSSQYFQVQHYFLVLLANDSIHYCSLRACRLENVRMIFAHFIQSGNWTSAGHVYWSALSVSCRQEDMYILVPTSNMKQFSWTKLSEQNYKIALSNSLWSLLHLHRTFIKQPDWGRPIPCKVSAFQASSFKSGWEQEEERGGQGCSR